MLTIKVPINEGFDSETKKFVTDYFEMELEHSLASLSKWESRFEKPFLGEEEKTPEEIFSYLQDMCLTPDVPMDVWASLTPENFAEVNTYINSSQTATTVRDTPQRPSGERITAELIYYWLVALQIPFEVQYWHLNKLLMLVKVCNVKNQPPKKMSRHEIAQRQRDLNAERKAKYGTSG